VLHGYQRYFQSRFFSGETKVRMCKTLGRPVLTYTSQTWTLIQAAELRLFGFERKILQKRFGPAQEKEEWRIRHKLEL